MKTQIFKLSGAALILFFGLEACSSKKVLTQAEKDQQKIEALQRQKRIRELREENAKKEIESIKQQAQLKAERIKAEQKLARFNQYQEKMQKFVKDGFTISGSSSTLKVALLKHYEELDSDKYEEIVVMSEGCPTVNLCSRKSLADAQSEYATVANSFVKGKVASEGGYNAAGTTEDEKAALDRFYAAYTQYVSANISGRLKRSFAIQKRVSGGYKYEGYYLVEKEAARIARMAALKKAQKETEQNIQWGQTIENWVNDVPEQQ